MKYKCLVLDHDDTVVDSTATIHFPCFIEYLGKYRPHLKDNYDIDSYFRKNFDPGILSLLSDEVGLSKEEIEHEGEYWREYVKGHIPRVYDGIREIIDEYLTRGGTIAVVSHSYRGSSATPCWVKMAIFRPPKPNNFSKSRDNSRLFASVWIEL